MSAHAPQAHLREFHRHRHGPQRRSVILIAVAAFAFTAPSIAAPEGTYTLIHSFTRQADKPAWPAGGLIRADGNFYGTSVYGGIYNKGTVFRMTPDGDVTTLHSFSGADGELTYVGLVQASNGLLYGTSSAGGSDNDGTIFSISIDGMFQLIHQFTPSGLGLSAPDQPLVQARDGNLYGTSWFGGDFSQGAVFRMTPEGVITIIHSFDERAAGGFSGIHPQGITVGSDGFLYGVTYASKSIAGCKDTSQGCGGVYKMTLDGDLVWGFDLTTAIGDRPIYPMVEAPDGNLYGTATYGGFGPYAGEGTVFRVAREGHAELMHSFSIHTGYAPLGLTLASDGALYGATNIGKQDGLNGSVYRMSLDGTFEYLKYFHKNDGKEPETPLAEGLDGTLYGTTRFGGAYFRGVGYRMSTVTSANQR